MDILWSVTIAANLILLFLLILRADYLDFPLFTFLIAFNIFTAPAIWYVYRYMPSRYAALYYGKFYLLIALWFFVVIEAYFMKRKQIAYPIEGYLMLKLVAYVLAHIGLVQQSNTIQQGMRLVNLAIILCWIAIFWPETTETMYDIS